MRECVELCTVYQLFSLPRREGLVAGRPITSVRQSGRARSMTRSSATERRRRHRSNSLPRLAMPRPPPVVLVIHAADRGILISWLHVEIHSGQEKLSPMPDFLCVRRKVHEAVLSEVREHAWSALNDPFRFLRALLAMNVDVKVGGMKRVFPSNGRVSGRCYLALSKFWTFMNDQKLSARFREFVRDRRSAPALRLDGTAGACVARSIRGPCFTCGLPSEIACSSIRGC